MQFVAFHVNRLIIPLLVGQQDRISKYCKIILMAEPESNFSVIIEFLFWEFRKG
jgi:hypothetical protein